MTRFHVRFQGYEIEATVTSDASVVHDWVTQISNIYYKKQITVGLYCEWKPPRRNNSIATLQLCVANKCIIIQMFRLEFIPQQLNAFLNSRNVTLVGAGVRFDVPKLEDTYGLYRCANIFDIQALAMARWPKRYKKPGLKELANDILGLYMANKPMHICRSNWESKVLTLEQIEYACIDTFASYKIGFKLLHSSTC